MNNKILYNWRYKIKEYVDNITGNECDSKLELNMIKKR